MSPSGAESHGKGTAGGGTCTHLSLPRSRFSSGMPLRALRSRVTNESPLPLGESEDHEHEHEDMEESSEYDDEGEESDGVGVTDLTGDTRDIALKVGARASHNEYGLISVVALGTGTLHGSGNVQVLYGRQPQRSAWVPTSSLTPQVSKQGTSTDHEKDTEVEVEVAHEPPALAAHERQRTMKTNRPPKGVRRAVANGWGVRKTKEPTKVTPSDRVRAFPNDCLEVAKGRLFCRACKHELSVRWSNFNVHINSNKHKRAAGAYQTRAEETDRLTAFMNDYYLQNPGEVGSGTAPATILFRWTVVESFLNSGTSLEKVEELRPLFELAGHPLTDHSHLKMFIPKILVKEVDLVRAEIADQYLTISFDGTTRLGEAVNLCARFIPADFSCVANRCLNLSTTATHMDGLGLYRHLCNLLLTKLQMSLTNIVGISRDSCATNGVACRKLLDLVPHAVDFLCTSHTLQHTGEHLDLPTVEAFMTAWLVLVSHSHATRLIWRSMVGTSMKSFCKTRWWSRWEVLKDLASNFASLEGFLNRLKDDGIGGTTTHTLQGIMAAQKEQLQLELATAMDVEVLCTTTYTLEGDGLEILLVHDALEAIRERGCRLGNDSSTLPNVAALLRARQPIAIGTATLEYYEAPHHRFFKGKVSAICSNSWTISYPDSSSLHITDENEIRRAIDVCQLPQWAEVVRRVKGAFNYLEDRLNDRCATPLLLQRAASHHGRPSCIQPSVCLW